MRIKKKKEKKLSVSQSFNPPKGVEIFFVAIVIEGIVVDIIRCEKNLHAMLISNPQLIDTTNKNMMPQIGWRYIVDKEGDVFIP